MQDSNVFENTIREINHLPCIPLKFLHTLSNTVVVIDRFLGYFCFINPGNPRPRPRLHFKCKFAVF